MLTVEALRAWGADTEDGLRRCMNNEAFYLRLVEKAVKDITFMMKVKVQAMEMDTATAVSWPSNTPTVER